MPDVLLIMGAIVLGASAILIARALFGSLRRNAGDLSKDRAKFRPIVALVLGVGVIVIGFLIAVSDEKPSLVSLILAFISMGLAAALPGMTMMVRSHPEFMQWARDRPSSVPPGRWLGGAVLSITAFTMFAGFLPMSYFIVMG